MAVSRVWTTGRVWKAVVVWPSVAVWIDVSVLGISHRGLPRVRAQGAGFSLARSLYTDFGLHGPSN